MPVTEHPHVSINEDLIGYAAWFLDASRRAGRPIAGWITLTKRLVAEVERLRAALAARPQPSAAESEFLAASVAVWREIDRLSNEPGGYHGLDAGTELRRRERTAWEAYRVEGPATLATSTGHTRGTTSAGPDYCEECSAAAQEWVRWPCPQVTQPIVAYVYHGPNGDQLLDPRLVDVARAVAGSAIPTGENDD